LINVIGPTGDAEAFWLQVKTNLQAGKIRLVFVADELPSELRRVVEFLNQQMDPAEVLAVEVKQFVGENLRTLVPSVVGQTEEAKIRKGTAAPAEGKQWTEESLLTDLSSKFSGVEVKAPQEILRWGKAHSTYVYWGKGKVWGSFVPVLVHNGKPHQLFALSTAGSVEIYFQTFQNRPAFASEERRLELLAKLNAIEGVSIPVTAITQRPTIKLSVLSNDNALQAFFAVYNWIVERITTFESSLPSNPE
jgi:hypothetical protein